MAQSRTGAGGAGGTVPLMAAGRRSVVAALGATQTLAWASSYYVPAVLAGPIAGDLGIPVAWFHAAFSGALQLTAMLGPAVGRAIDRRGGRDVLCLSNLVLAAGLVLLAAARGPGSLGLAWAVLGAGMALGLYDAAFATLAGLYGREARAAISGITLIAGFASTVGWPVSALLQAEFGWRGACLAWAAANLLLALPLNLALVPPAPPPPAAAASGPVPPAARRRAMGLLAFVFAVIGTISTGMAAHLPRLLQEAGATAAGAVVAAALIGPAQVAARLGEFALQRRLHPLAVARLATVLHPAGAALLLVLGGPAAAGFAVLHGAGNGLLTIARGTLPLALFGPQGYGLRTGVLAAPGRVAQAAAPLLFSLLLDRMGAWTVAVSAGLGLASLVALLALSAAPEDGRAG